MMTFIVIGDFVLNAQILSMEHLGKQRVEAKQIIDILLKGSTSGAWVNHTAVRSWRGFIDALKYYANCIIQEFIRRGGNNTMPLYELPEKIDMPWWARWNRLHQSHRAMLYRKNPFHYHDKFTIEEPYLSYGYIWPCNVSFENQNDDLSKITADIPKELINPVYCCGILKSGNRKNQYCQRLVKDKYHLCKIHRKS